MANYYKDYGAGFAGRRPMGWRPKGVVIHNTAGNGDTALGYFNSVIPGRVASNTMNLGYTHYYIDSQNVCQVANTMDGAWHTANPEGNMNYVGYEVCNSYGPEDQFLANEQATFKQVAKDMLFWGIEPNRSTVRLHREFYATACPHRSWDLHGKSVNAVKDYFILQIKKYMNEPASKPVDRIAYRIHQQDIKWSGWTGENKIAGTTGQGLRGEAIQIDPKGLTCYAEAHIQDIGWVNYGKINAKTVIGTTGQSKRLEGLKLKFVGAKVKARVHMANKGWSQWYLLDGTITLGTAGESSAIEAIEFDVL